MLLFSLLFFTSLIIQQKKKLISLNLAQPFFQSVWTDIDNIKTKILD